MRGLPCAFCLAFFQVRCAVVADIFDSLFWKSGALAFLFEASNTSRGAMGFGSGVSLSLPLWFLKDKVNFCGLIGRVIYGYAQMVMVQSAYLLTEINLNTTIV